MTKVFYSQQQEGWKKEKTEGREREKNETEGKQKKKKNKKGNQESGKKEDYVHFLRGYCRHG